jgi:transcriptional regulator with XRE-family HTH domain
MGKTLCQIGDILASFRIKKGIHKAKDFAKLMGVSNSFLSKMERGHVPMTIARLSAYAKVLSLEPVDIIECWFKENNSHYNISDEQWEQFKPVIQDLLIVLDKRHFHD